MKKILAMVSAAALTGLSMMAAIEWGSVENLSRGATVTVSSNFPQSNAVTDNNNGTRWQAIPSTHRFTTDWALVDLGEVKTFTDIEIKWEGSHAKRYSLYVSEEAIPYETLSGNVNTEDNPLMLDYNKIDEAWLAAATPAATGADDTEGSYTANHSFADAVSGRYILVYADELNGNGTNYGLSIWELRVANIEGRDEVAALTVTPATAKPGASAQVTVKPVNAIGEEVALDRIANLSLTSSDPASVTVSGGENGVFAVSGATPGVYTLTATAKAGDATVSGTANFTVEFVWDGIENVAAGKSIMARYIPGMDNPHPAEHAVDGDMETYYEYNGAWAGGDAWLLIDLGSEYMVEAIGGAYGDNSTGRVKFGYSLDNEGILGYVGNNSQWIWNNDNVPAGWTFKEATRANNSIATVIFAAPVKARYIAVRDVDNPGGKPQLREVLVKGEQIQPSYAADMEITFDKGGLFVGETANVSLTIVDQYGNPFGSADDAVITVEGADYADGVITATAKGMVNVKAVSGETEKTATIMVADQADYCMAGATITSDEAKSTPAAAIDGGANPNEHGALYVVTENESQGEHTHWILADLHKPHDLDMIIAIWEGACPADYDVYVGATETELVKLYSVTGHNQATWYDRFSGKEMNGVQFIKIVTTRNATGYGIKLFDLKAYGTSNVTSEPASIAITADGDNIATDESVPVTASVLDQYGATMADVAVTYTCSPATAQVVNNMFKAEATGTYEVVASYGELSGSVTINVVADAAKKITPAHTATLNDNTLANNVFTAETQMPELPASLVIALDGVYDFDLLKLRWEAACPSHYTVKATYANGTEAEILSVADRGFMAGTNPVDRIINDGTSQNVMIRAAISNAAKLNEITKLTITPTAKDHGYGLRLFGIDAYGEFNADVTGLGSVNAEGASTVDVYSLQGVMLRGNVDAATALDGLPQGVYIVGGVKIAK